MGISKYRLETFTDGVIAIIITIMVLSIPLPASFETNELVIFGTSLAIYLLSFLVVGAFWNQHHQAFTYLEKVNQNIIVANIFFLFFLSLIPLFTKWVIENQGSLIPVIGFDTVYFLVSFFYILTFRLIMKQSEHHEFKLQPKKMRGRRNPGNFSWLPLLILLIIISGVVAISIYRPKLATFILMGIPILSSIVNLFVFRQGKSIQLKEHHK